MSQTKQDDEDRRKIQFTGGSTYIISLPKKWIALNRLKKGSYIRLREEADGLLTVVPPAAIIQEKSGKATVKMASNDNTAQIIRKIISLYLAGYSMICVKAEPFSTKQRHELKDVVRRLLVGTEIVLDTSNQVMLQVLLTYPELTILNTLRRMSIITKSMHRDAVLALKTKDVQLANEISLTDSEVDRFNLYVTRLLRSAIQNPRISKEIGLMNAKDCLSYIIVTRLIERTADHAAAIAENSLNLKNDLKPEVIEKIEQLSRLAIGMFDESMEALFRQDFSVAERVIEELQKVMTIEKQAVIYSQGNPEDFAYLRLIIESLRRTAEYASDVAEIVLNLNAESISV